MAETGHPEGARTLQGRQTRHSSLPVKEDSEVLGLRSGFDPPDLNRPAAVSTFDLCLSLIATVRRHYVCLRDAREHCQPVIQYQGNKEKNKGLEPHPKAILRERERASESE